MPDLPSAAGLAAASCRVEGEAVLTVLEFISKRRRDPSLRTQTKEKLRGLVAALLHLDDKKFASNLSPGDVLALWNDVRVFIVLETYRYRRRLCAEVAMKTQNALGADG